MMHLQNAEAVHGKKNARQDQAKRNGDGTGASFHVFPTSIPTLWRAGSELTRFSANAAGLPVNAGLVRQTLQQIK
jgi:hypothetical protein